MDERCAYVSFANEIKSCFVCLQTEREVHLCTCNNFSCPISTQLTTCHIHPPTHPIITTSTHILISIRNQTPLKICWISNQIRHAYVISIFKSLLGLKDQSHVSLEEVWWTAIIWNDSIQHMCLSFFYCLNLWLQSLVVKLNTLWWTMLGGRCHVTSFLGRVGFIIIKKHIIHWI